MSALQVIEAGHEQAEHVRALLQSESLSSVEAALAESGGLLVLRRSVPVGALLFDRSRPGQLGLARVSGDPARQRSGVASAMVGAAEDLAESLGLDGVWLREEFAENLDFWTRRGYLPTASSGRTVELGKTLELACPVPSAQDMHELGAELAGLCRPGDVLVLSGQLGAGKTTLTQGIGRGLGVRGAVTSPTFVLARVHPPLADGPALVHADAYRLGGAAELDDLDLDASLQESVTVVEWGQGLVEGLSESWLDIRIEPAPGRDGRLVTVRPYGPRWVGVPLRSTLQAALGVPC